MSLRGAVYSGPLAKYCVTTAYEALQRAFPGGGPYTFIHDFSELRDYDSEARKVLLDFGRKLGNSGRSIMCLSMELRPLLRIGISTATALVASLGLHVETTNDSPLQVLKRVGFTPLIRS